MSIAQARAVKAKIVVAATAALAACATPATEPQSDPAADAIAAFLALPENQPTVVMAFASEPGAAVQTLVMAPSAAAAERERDKVLGLYARTARNQNFWGFEVATEWREVPRDEAVAGSGMDLNALAETAGTPKTFVLDVAYLKEPVATEGANVYAAADVIAASPWALLGEEN